MVMGAEPLIDFIVGCGIVSLFIFAAGIIVGSAKVIHKAVKKKNGR